MNFSASTYREMKKRQSKRERSVLCQCHRGCAPETFADYRAHENKIHHRDALAEACIVIVISAHIIRGLLKHSRFFAPFSVGVPSSSCRIRATDPMLKKGQWHEEEADGKFRRKNFPHSPGFFTQASYFLAWGAMPKKSLLYVNIICFSRSSLFLLLREILLPLLGCYSPRTSSWYMWAVWQRFFFPPLI